jgi:hypothetical protein
MRLADLAGRRHARYWSSTMPATETLDRLEEALRRSPGDSARAASKAERGEAEAETDPGQGLLVGYLSYARDGGWCWAALVVMTAEGDPVELVYTEPLVVGGLQRQLLGDRLDAYLLSSVLLPPLLDRLQSRPAFLCCDQPAVLQRRLPGGIPALVFAPGDAFCNAAAWTMRPGPAEGNGERWWFSRHGGQRWPAVLDDAVDAMAPFGIRDPFKQLHAAMAELRRDSRAR